MNKTDTHAFVNQLLVYTLVMICFSGSVGLGTVWLRHQISVTANNTKQVEARLTEVERRIAETSALIAAEQSPDRLEQKNTFFALGLVRPSEPQTVRVNESPEQRLTARNNLDIFRGDGARATPVRFRVAESSR